MMMARFPLRDRRPFSMRMVNNYQLGRLSSRWHNHTGAPVVYVFSFNGVQGFSGGQVVVSLSVHDG